MAKLEVRLACKAIHGTSFSAITRSEYKNVMESEYWQEGLQEVINMQQIEIISTASEYSSVEVTLGDYHRVFFAPGEGVDDPKELLTLEKLPVTEFHRFARPAKMTNNDVIILHRDSYKGWLAAKIDVPDGAKFDPKHLAIGIIDLPSLNTLVADERVKFLIDFGAIPAEQNFRSIIYDGIEESLRAEIEGWRISEYVAIKWSDEEKGWIVDQLYFDKEYA